jgi:hypothetical protein
MITPVVESIDKLNIDNCKGIVYWGEEFILITHKKPTHLLITI